MQAERLIRKILAVRQHLLNHGLSGKNAAKCVAYHAEIKRYLVAYGHKWTEEGWTNFALRHFDQLQYLIPENKAGKTLKQQLYELKSNRGGKPQGFPGAGGYARV